MKTSTPQDLSPLVQHLVNKNQPPTFSIPIRTPENESPVFKLSIELDEDAKYFDPMEVKRLRRNDEPIFPPILGDTYTIPSKPLGPFSAEPWPLSFTEEEWRDIWNSDPIRIDRFLKRTSNASPIDSYVVKENQFKGAPWRLIIDSPKKGIHIPIFRHGMVLSYRNSNRLNRRYIISYLRYVDKDQNIAYVQVICYSSRCEVLDAQSKYPPFILAIPLELCEVRSHPDFEITPHITVNSPTPDASTEVLPLTLPSYFSIDQEETPGWKEKLYRFFFSGRTRHHSAQGVCNSKLAQHSLLSFSSLSKHSFISVSLRKNRCAFSYIIFGPLRCI
jgi:hypothetical protein